VIKAPHGRGFGHYLVGVLLNVAVFVGLGPVAGCIVFFLIIGILAGGFPVGPLAGLYFMVGGSFLIVPAAYLVGSPAAAATGVGVAVASSWICRPLYLYGFAAAIGGLAAMFLTHFQDRNLTSASEQLMMFVTGAVAALICTRAARPFRLDRHSATMAGTA
jgi:hypothetical protein